MLSGSYQLPNNENSSRSVSSSTRGISVTPDIVVDKRSHLELLVVFCHEGCDQVSEDHSIQVVGAVKGESVKMKGNSGGNGSHDQRGMGDD